MRKVIAIDFDGCLCSNKWPQTGEPDMEVIGRAKAEQQKGAALILWTNREGELLEEAVRACMSWGLVFDAVNANLPEWTEHFKSDPRKIGATEYWDDKAIPMGNCRGSSLSALGYRQISKTGKGSTFENAKTGSCLYISRYKLRKSPIDIEKGIEPLSPEELRAAGAYLETGKL